MKNRLLLLIGFLGIQHILHSQAPDIFWEHTYGGTETDESWAVRQAPDGGYIVAGTSYSGDVDLDGNYGSRDYCLVKTDAYGIKEWAHHYGSSALDYCYDAICAFDGGYLLMGYTYGNDYDVSELNGPSDIWIAKVDEEGGIEWERSYGGSVGEIGQCIIATRDSCYVFAGYTNSNDFDVSGNHGDDTWVVKINQEGDILWQTCLGGSDAEFAYGICQTEDGGYGIVSTSLSTDGQVGLNHGGYDYWLSKIDSSGNFQWGHVYGGSELDWPRQVISTQDNGFLIAGYTESSNGDVTVNYGFYDYWIVKTDSAGNLEWQKSYGGSVTEEAFDVIQCTDGGYAVCGHTTSSDGDITGFHGPSIFADTWVIKIDNLGNLIWQKALGGTGTDNGNSIIEIEPETYIVAGCSSSSDGDVAENIGVKDYWLLKLGDCTETTYYADTDEDGYGDSAHDTVACELPLGFVVDNTDCDDSNIDIHPGVIDTCNAIDDNCNGEIDEDATFMSYYADMDGDNFGDMDIDSLSCTSIDGYTPDSTDCDDNNPDIYPGTAEIANGVDDNCNGLIDEGLGIDQNITPQITLYPNPANNSIALAFNAKPTGPVQAEIWNNLGEIWRIFEIKDTSTVLDISAYPEGIYFVILEVENVSYSFSFLKIQ
ncbi:MAG: MopE-related protein [Chitinophagales bacterium]